MQFDHCCYDNLPFFMCFQQAKECPSSEFINFKETSWLLLYSCKSSTEETPTAVPVFDDLANVEKLKKNTFKKQNIMIRR